MDIIVKEFPPIDTNVTILSSPEEKIIIVFDAPKGSYEFAKRWAERNGYRIEALFLTHSHWDHIADASYFEKAEIPIFVHELDAQNLIKPGSDGLSMVIGIDPVKHISFFKEGQPFHLGKIPFYPVHTPGHTPGGTCFYFPTENLLISGDTLFNGTFGRIDLPHSDPKAMKNSLSKLSKLPLNTRFYPGHGAFGTIGEQSWLRDVNSMF
jgi:glyoxylase-like metal-dependent hydrolase (beta-lactamase superfamily II)